MPDGDTRDVAGDDPVATRRSEPDELERASENVLEGWPTSPSQGPAGPAGPTDALDGAPDGVTPTHGEEVERVELPSSHDGDDERPAIVPATGSAETKREATSEHAPGSLAVPPGYPVLEGEPTGGRRAVGIVVSRFNGEVTSRLLRSALDELGDRGVDQASITVMPVPGAFELPLAAMALAKTRRFACIVALGCVIRGDTHHFDYVAGEAASGLQLAAIETGVPVSFGVLTLERLDQADARIEKGADAVRTALEMADLFANLRTAAAR